MSVHKYSRVFVRLLAGLLLLASVFAAAVGPASAAPAAPDRNDQRYERRTMKLLMNHHLFEVEIARLCLTQAIHPELISLCQRLVNTLPQEITTLQSWLQSWYGESYTPRLTSDQRGTIRRLGLSRVQGAKFEIQSMKLYRGLFRQGVNIGTVCARRAIHAELGTLCGQGIVTNSQDFSSVSRWLCDWWERCFGGREPSLLLNEDW